MLHYRTLHNILRQGMLLCCLFMAVAAHAQGPQADTAGKVRINILNARVIVGVKTDSGEFQRSIGDVVMQQGTDTLYCDSLIRNETTNIAEAFGHVRIAQQDGTQATSDYLRYTANQKLAFMSGDVHLTDGKNNMECEELTYNLGTKMATYDNWGKLTNDSTVITSKAGEYDGHTKEARFKGDARIVDPQSVTHSEDIAYNTETRLSRFFAKSVVVGDSGRQTLRTTNGYYDQLKGEAYFVEHSSITNADQYIEGDTLYYNKLTGYGYGYGHVIAWDTTNHSILYCGKTIYYRKKRVLWAYVKPVLVQANGKDTLYVRADTFYSAPEVGYKAIAKDSTAAATTVAVTSPNAESQASSPQAPAKGKKKKPKKEPAVTAVVVADTAQADTSAPLFFTGFHHVRIFSDSLQAVCDSVVYTRHDSTIRLIYAPVAWSRSSQITGDTINLLMDSNKLRNIYVPNNGFMVSRSGPEKAQLYDQVQGRFIKAWFRNNTIEQMKVYPNAEAIYYSTDDHGAYIGVQQATGDSLIVVFSDQKIKTIRLLKENHNTLTPLDKADLPSMRLKRFKWLDSRRPRSKNELFE